MASITVVSGESTGDYYPLAKRTMVIGRDEAVPIQVKDDRVSRKHLQSVTLGEVAEALAPESSSRGARTPHLSAEEWFYTDHQTYSYGIQIAVVAVDGETGAVDIERFFIAYDIGRAINPKMVEGQLIGGLAQGIGGTLFEEFLYDERGEPLSVTFVDYLLPTLREVSTPELLLKEDAPSSRNPLGIKGAGECGITGTPGAIAAAIDDAIGIPGAVTRIPITPQRLKKILDERPRPVD